MNKCEIFKKLKKRPKTDTPNQIVFNKYNGNLEYM